MTTGAEQLRSGDLPVAATRPTLVPWVGIPFKAAVPLFGLCFEVALFLGSFQGWLYAAAIFVAVCVPLRAWVSRDWYALDAIMVAIPTSLIAFDAPQWGGSTLSPYPLRPDPLRPRGCAHV
jgi:type IV secretory pathway VirB3-like protein